MVTIAGRPVAVFFVCTLEEVEIPCFGSLGARLLMARVAIDTEALF